MRRLAVEVHGERSGNTRRVPVTCEYRIVINLNHANIEALRAPGRRPKKIRLRLKDWAQPELKWENSPESHRLSAHQTAEPIPFPPGGVQNHRMSENPNKAQRTVDSLKLLQDWSKWLISLEAIVCMSLWPKLTSKPAPSGLMYTGWMMFWASILIAAILLLSISFFVRRVDVSSDRDMKKVWIMVGLQYSCFLAGLFCFALNVIIVWTLG